ncbi:hypothetical protein NPIL_216591 [Nephila pilipes]|uniref:Uncharacterized protein n=1 Tax=Nephila pilipes TaxID=299642 RepID=A0A8X6UGA8_NEPPI|nr:hypothetical protein NPIL_216591 [Nephila pilipes]
MKQQKSFGECKKKESELLLQLKVLKLPRNSQDSTKHHFESFSAYRFRYVLTVATGHRFIHQMAFWIVNNKLMEKKLYGGKRGNENDYKTGLMFGL